MNYETICNPIPDAEVDGFNFFRDQNGTIIARCCWCMIGFDVTTENAATIRPMMIMHLQLVHGLRGGLRGVLDRGLVGGGRGLYRMGGLARTRPFGLIARARWSACRHLLLHVLSIGAAGHKRASALNAGDRLVTDTTAQLVVLVARQPPAVFTADRRAALKHANRPLAIPAACSAPVWPKMVIPAPCQHIDLHDVDRTEQADWHAPHHRATARDRLTFEPIKVSMSRRACGLDSTQANVCISPGRRCQQRRRAALLTARNPVLRHAIVAIVQMDGSFEAARMD